MLFGHQETRTERMMNMARERASDLASAMPSVDIDDVEAARALGWASLAIGATELAAPHFGLTPADVKEILATSLAYTSREEAAAYLGKAGARGTLHDIFDTVMTLNIDNGAADNKLDSNLQIDNSVINSIATP